MRIAHKTLPFGTWVRIRNVRNGREAVAMVNDRGPFYGGRVIDAAQRAAARADEQSAVTYARRHPHGVLAEAGHVAIRGVVDITTTGVRIVVGVVRGVLELGWDALKER